MSILALFVALFTLSSPADAQSPAGSPATETRAVSGFHAISVADGVDLRVRQGAESVTVRAATPADRDRIRTVVEWGVLKIWFESGSLLPFTRGGRHLQAEVSLPVLDALSAADGSDIVLVAPFTVQSLGAQLSGGSGLTGELAAGSLALGASGGSDTRLTGRAGSLALNASGATDFEGFGFAVKTCTVSLSGGSDVAITVNRDLVVQASSGSDVVYAGAGLVRAQSTSGGSSVRQARR